MLFKREGYFLHNFNFKNAIKRLKNAGLNAILTNPKCEGLSLSFYFQDFVLQGSGQADRSFPHKLKTKTRRQGACTSLFAQKRPRNPGAVVILFKASSLPEPACKEQKKHLKGVPAIGARMQSARLSLGRGIRKAEPGLRHWAHQEARPCRPGPNQLSVL